MATTNTERYVRMTLLTFDGGTLICKEILVREVNRIPGSPCLSSLLQTNKKAIKEKLNTNAISGKHYFILKKTIVNETCLKDWDVQLLVKIILFLFESTLPGQDIAYLKDILAIRNELICHRSQASINEQQFNVNWTKMTCCLIGLSSGLEDVTVQGVTKIIEDLTSGPLDLQSSISKIAEHCRNDEHMENVLAALSRIENSQDQLATGIDSANNKLDDVIARLEGSGNHHWNVDIPILQSKVHISCESKELSRFLSEVLLKDFKTYISEQSVDQTDPAAVSRAVHKWLDELKSMGATVVTAKKGSILLWIRCNTVQALFNLLNMYQKSGNRIRLVGIENTLNEVYKTDTKLELVLVEESIELLSNWIDEQMCSALSNRSDEMPHTSELTLGIQCRSLDTVLQVTDYFQNGSAANRLNQLSKALSADYANERVRVDATLGIGEFTDALTSNNEALVTEGTQSKSKNVPTKSIQETVQTQPTSATVEVNREPTKTIPAVTSLGKRVTAEPTADEAEDVASTSTAAKEPPVKQISKMAAMRLQDECYLNWLRDSMALLFLKEGIEDITDKRVADFHGFLLGEVTQQTPQQPFPSCNICTNQQVQRHKNTWKVSCPSKVCNTWIKEILKQHADGQNQNMACTNLQPHLWSTHPWEVAKCFLPQGNKHVNAAKDADVAAVLNLMKSCTFMFKFFPDRSLVQEVLEIRHALMHSSKMNASDVQLQDDTGKMVQLLNSLVDLSPAERNTIQGAIDNINKLRSKAIDVTLERETIVLSSRMHAVESELASHRAKCCDYETNTRQDLTKTSEDLKALENDNKQTKAELTQLKDIKDRFEEFLRKNNLTQDVAKLLTTLQGRSQKIDLHSQMFVQQDQRLYALEQKEKDKVDIPAGRDVGSWEEQCNELQAILMQHYRDTCLLVQNPLDNTRIGMEYMYVEPAVRILRQSKGRDGLKNVKDDAESMSCRKIFYTDSYRARQIYITGDAGLGKSMLCKHLVELWCEAHGDCVSIESEESTLYSWRKEEKKKARTVRQKERKDRREENKHILSQFKFLFYITLRDCLSEYKISDMIQSQLLQHYDDIKHVQASDVLKKECCLVIVDGLDEWVCPKGRSVPHFVNPGIPGRNILNKNNVFLTTSRPWKFDVLELNDSEVDKHAELCGLEKLSASQFCSKIIKLLNKSKAQRKKKKEFFRTLKQKGLSHFETIPVILIQLICLWFDDQELCQSQVQLYCAMLNLLLRKAQKKLTGQTTITPMSGPLEVSLHKCFMNHPYCQYHQQLIHCLSKVAFEALVDKTKENQLVFESSQMEIYGVDEESVNMCLKYGILSQSKMFDKCALSEKKISFLHKKFQEFLASVYIANSDDVQEVAKRVTDFCGTLKDCLEMSQVWLFVCGMSPDIARHLLKHFTDVITADTDKQIQKYRQSLGGQGLIRDIHTFVADCLIEGENNGHAYDKIGLEDLYIDRNTFSHVERALPGNKVSGIEPIYCRTISNAERVLLGNVTSCIKSMYIDTSYMTVYQSTLITGLLLHSQAVQKLHLDDYYQSHITRETLTTFLHNCRNKLTSIELVSNVTLTESGVTSICHSSSECLMALRLFGVGLTHVDTIKLLNGLSQSHTIRHLDLSLVCTDHSRQCRPRIYMSTMTQLQTLRLWYMHVDNLPTVTQCMEDVDLWEVTLPMAALCEFARRISQTKRYVDVTLRVTVREEREDRVDLETFLRGCPGLTVTHCRYDDSDNTWTIVFHTNKQ